MDFPRVPAVHPGAGARAGVVPPRMQGQRGPGQRPLLQPRLLGHGASHWPHW